MTLTSWLSLVTICILGAMSPGPSLAVVLKHSIANSTKHGLVVAFTHGIGVGLYAVAALLGLASLLLSMPVLYKVLVYLGAAYLLFMGIRALISKQSPFSPDLKSPQQASLSVAAIDGFTIAFLNPKLAVFFIALFSQLIDPDTLNLVTGAVMAGTVLVIDIVWYCVVAGIIHHTRERFDFSKRAKLFDKIAGLVFIGLAIRVVFI